MAPRSGVACPTSIPKRSAPRIMRNTSALRSSALVGMQPQFRQTPPNWAFSTRAVRKPSWLARMAATYPPGPPPTTITSNLLSLIGTSSDQHAQRVFHQALEHCQPLRRQRAIHGPVIHRQGAAQD